MTQIVEREFLRVQKRQISTYPYELTADKTTEYSIRRASTNIKNLIKKVSKVRREPRLFSQKLQVLVRYLKHVFRSNQNQQM